MRQPTIQTTVRDPEHDMIYHILAFRALTEAEAMREVQQYLSQPRLQKRKTPERGLTVKIHTLIGT